MEIRVPPPSASIATAPDASGKLYAPSAARNTESLCQTISSIVPPTGNALEIASGTGQHIVAFAAAMPAFHWHPSEVEQVRLNSIAAYIFESGLSNIAPPLKLNATQPGWGDTIAPKDLILTANLFHLISAVEVSVLLEEAAKALVQRGLLCVYGPFKRDGELTSEGDTQFDASLRTSDPEIGYKDDAWIKSEGKKANLEFTQAIDMPANNLALVFQRQQYARKCLSI